MGLVVPHSYAHVCAGGVQNRSNTSMPPLVQVTNVGTSTITSHIGGPIRVTAPSGSDVMLAGPNCWGQPLRNRLNGYLYETTAGGCQAG